ncbi:hypothetical protein PFISCL1PPCAC_20840, partial [Pristionchus fissidentatus]
AGAAVAASLPLACDYRSTHSIGQRHTRVVRTAAVASAAVAAVTLHRDWTDMRCGYRTLVIVSLSTSNFCGQRNNYRTLAVVSLSLLDEQQSVPCDLQH